MEEKLFNFLIWVAGVDCELIKKTPVSEKIKHSGIGALVLIPSLLALVSMTYAISTLTDSLYISLLFGFFWSGIIFSIDRFIISTFRKSEKLSDDLKKGSFWMRIVLASIFGIAVSHPFVLLYFDQSINERIQISLKTNINNEVIKTNKEKDSVFYKIDILQDKVEEKRSHIKCLIKLFTAEQSGNKVFLPCGSSSGVLNYGNRAKNLEVLIMNEKRELDSIKKEIKPQVNQYFNQIKQYDSILAITTKNLKENLSKDYLARDKALNELSMDKINGGTVNRDTYFIILLFLFIDILCVLLKVFTPRGPYDDLLDKQEYKFSSKFAKNKEVEKLLLSSEIDFLNTDGLKFHKDLFSEKNKHIFIKKSIQKIFKHETDFDHEITKELMRFGDFYNKDIKRINKMKSVNRKKKELDILLALQKSFYEKIGKAIEINKT